MTVSLEQIMAGTPPAPPKTKIVCTLGPKSRSVEVLEELLRSGMSVARFNFSHGSHEYHLARTRACRALMVYIIP